MRAPKLSILILGLGLVSFLAAIGIYISAFGTDLSDVHSRWSEFGDFFGGLLNPVLAFLAIVMLFITLMSQMNEFRESVKHLESSAKTAREELDLIRSQTTDNEVLAVLGNADQQISLLLQSEVSDAGSTPRLTIFHLCLESGRFSSAQEWTLGYARFVEQAQTPGSVVWSYVHALSETVGRVAEILEAYSLRHAGEYSPTMMYYHHRMVGLTRMLADTGYMSEEERVRIVTMADQHG